jgi:NAD(P)-dependent dehydrogenase (short-subunit alcohol dehydrogenase family)
LTGEPLRFDGRVAIVTGGGRGLGLCHARTLTRLGARVLLTDTGVDQRGHARDPDVAAAAATAIADEGGTAIADARDVADPEVAELIVQRAIEELGGLHIIVGSASILRLVPFEDTTIADLQAALDVDPIGHGNLLDAAWPHLTAQGYGRVVLSSSTSHLGGAANAVPYAVGKGATHALARERAAAGREHGILVNTITPFGFTRMVSDAPKFTPEELAERRRLGAPEAVSTAVVVLAHERCPVTGHVFNIGNGRVTELFEGETAGLEGSDESAEQLLERWDAIDATEGWARLGVGA